MKPLALALAAAALCVPALAIAQPGLQPLAPLPAAADAAPIKDGTSATLIALGTTAAGIGMLTATDAVSNDSAALVGWTGFALTMIGPSAGHLYAGEYGHSALTSLGRTAAVGSMAAGFVMALDECYDDCSDSDDGLSGALMLGGAAALAGLTLYDLWDAHRAADRFTQRHAVRLTPTALTTPHGRAGGLALSGRF